MDGSDDTLIGLLNSSSETITSIQMSSDSDIFGFDGHGLCAQSPAPAGCPFGSTGYEGPGTNFAGITPDQSGGVVDFNPGIAPGQSAYFSLAESLNATTVTAGGPSPGEQGGPVNPSENPTTCSTASPVNCATGVFWRQSTDVTVPGRGVAVNFSRTYSSSQASVAGPFGFGWTDSYAMSLAIDAEGDVTVTQEDGSTVTFLPNGDGGYTAPPRVLATLTENTDGSYTFVRDRGQAQYTFSSAGQLTSEVDTNGYTTQLAYNASGQLMTVADPAGRTLMFSYSGSHVAQVTDPMGRTWSYSYDPSGNLASATDPQDRIWSFRYDQNHLLQAVTDPRGGVTTNVYSGGQVISQTDPDGNTTAWSYSGDPASPGGGATTVTDPNGNMTVYRFSSLELTSVTRAAGTAQAATTSYGYDPDSLGVTSLTDPDGNITSSVYDLSGNLLSTTDPRGNTTIYSYNSLNEVQTKASPLGETTRYGYDPRGNLLTLTDPANGTTNYAYADSAHPGDITSATNPDGNATSYSYDADGDITSVTASPSAGITDTTGYAYDADGERTCQASANATAAGVSCPAAGRPPADTTAAVYDADGEITSVTDPDGHVTGYTYDGDGNKVQVTDPSGHVTGYAYNGDNEQTKITRPDGSMLSASYDPAGNLTSQTDAADRTTAYAYDALNRVTSATNPLGRTTSYGYDADSNRTKLTDPAGRVTTYTYSAASELTSISYSDRHTPNVTISYDADGQRSGMTDGTGTTRYDFDSDGRLKSVADGAGATVSYAYDPAGNLTGLTYPGGGTVSRSYDGLGLLTAVTDWLGHKTTFGYDRDGNLTSEAYPGQVVASATFDNADQMMSITDRNNSSTLATFSYTRNAHGQVTSEAATGDVLGKHTFSYTQLSQIGSDNANTYSYDPANDPVKLATGTAQTFNAGGEVISSQHSATAKAPAADQVVSASQTSKGKTIVSPAFTTAGANELVLALVSADGPPPSPTVKQSIAKVSGGPLQWSLAAQANTKQGTAEIWQAYSATPLTDIKVTATLADTGQDGSITIATFTGAQQVIGARATASGDSASPTATLTTTAADSLIWGIGDDSSNASNHTVASGQILVNQYLDTGSHATYWTQKTGAVTNSGTSLKLSATTTAKDNWNMAAVEITSASGTKTSYSYNSSGNRTTIIPSAGPGIGMTYDQAGRLIAYGDVASYAYNGDGLRMSKTVSGQATPFAWDQSGAVPVVISAGALSYVYGPGNLPIEQIRGSMPNYLQADQQGSTRLLTDSAGTVVGTYSYTPYGSPTNHTGTVSTALQYDGQFTDNESGFQYLQARYYDRNTFEFLTVDPALSLTAAPYGYAADDPLDTADPTGLTPWNPLSWTSDTWKATATGTPWADAAAEYAGYTANAGNTAHFAVAGEGETYAPSSGGHSRYSTFPIRYLWNPSPDKFELYEAD